ncbi:MAG: GntR family transcriptional regulator [Trueperaceae bacterium]|nr:GntR family transcriptional regulator [Trueperaceae bacterium]
MDNLEIYLSKQHKKRGSNRTRREEAYDRIKDAIRHAELKPGEPLSETRLSKLLGISRTPVREALQQLVQEGLVETAPGQTVTVASRSIQDVLDVVHIRSLLEPELVRLAAESISKTQIEQLEAIILKLEEAAKNHDLAAWAKVDVRFHEIIKEACPNKLLGQTVVQLKNRVHQVANIDTHTNPERLVACTQEHRDIFNAIKARDGNKARQAMETHIAALTNSLLKRISYR